MINAPRLATSVLISFLMTAQPGFSMEFSVGKIGEGRQYILGTGDIRPQDEIVLSSMIASLPEISMVVLSSPGGSVSTAIGMGETVRNADIETMVAPKGQCLSACLFAFIGGTKRHVPTSAQLGSHQFRWSDNGHTTKDAQIAQALSAKVLRHFIAMGVDPDALTYVLETPPNDMFVFTDFAMEKFKLTTPSAATEKKIVVDRCTGEVVGAGPERECTDEAYWRNITVPDFLKAHPEYAAGSSAHTALDREVRLIQANASNPFDPDILVRAHRRVMALSAQ
ncbi:MAG: hypothetical protein PGN22_15675 [Agrobacterium cavarae]